MWRDPAYLLDILDAARLILSYVQDIDQQALKTDPMRQDAIMRRFGIIGEAARRLSEEFRASHPDIPWQEMIGMRNRLIHEYNKVELDTVWKVIQTELPKLIEQIEPLVPPDEPDDEEKGG